MKSIYLTYRFFAAIFTIAIVFVIGFFLPSFFTIAVLLFIALMVITNVEIIALYSVKKGVDASRMLNEKLSNGDENPIIVSLHNNYPYTLYTKILDELPEQFQERHFSYNQKILPGKDALIKYNVRPVKRGEYNFGAVNVYASTIFYFVRRRYRFAKDVTVPVYPSFIQLRKYELLALSNRLAEAGIKKIRRIGISMEFDQIRDYVAGDDYRTINWKATARRSSLMVNQFQDEKAQQVYSIIDKGRAMKMPFEGMSLLDYAVNASLVVSNIALLKGDKAGLLTFSEVMGTFLPAERKTMQMHSIMEVLYNQKSRFLEPDVPNLYSFIRKKISQRSLLLFYTNFETLSALRRQLPYFRMMAKRHLLVIVFFENTEIRELLNNDAKDVENIYVKVIAEKFAFEKRQIVKELERNGIYAILTQPKNLTVNTINKYLELKSRGLI